ncbi:9558_t:CDS:10 [Ambispora leptoticha]|uniref:9558_t:CDS:1 n=1 Tax=Ambispora leptoticha TaxID=144679 RepID=A0A9N9FJJ7_9GLOM|nr:9558_t:CDS:10 [Ambispora leptoticha]
MSIHEYFERASSKWNITDFLEECDLEPYHRKIESYTKSLEIIADMEKGKRKDKAQNLIQDFGFSHKASVGAPGNFGFIWCSSLRGDPALALLGHWEQRPDYKVARKWKETKEQNSARGPSFIISGTVVGPVGFNEGTLNSEIDNFFQGPSKQKITNPIKKRRKSENINNKREISNETDKEEDETEPEAQESVFISDDDNSDYILSDFEDEIPLPQLLLSSQLKDFQESYKKMNVAHKWVLASGKCVEDTLFEYCRRQPVESLLHSWIIDLDDRETDSLFTTEEWNEIQCAVKILPKVDRTFADSMMRFSNVKTASDLRLVLETTSFLNEDEPYDRVKHYDAEWAEIVMRKFLTYYEDPNETLQKQHLESWYDINVWSLIIDHGLCDVIGMETVRKESSSVAVATRKNRKRARTLRRKPERKKMGYRMDGIFRMYIGDVEYGATEVAKKFDTAKLLTDGFKLVKAMHDIFVCLSEKVRFEEKKVRQLRVAGMLHMGLKLQVLQMSSPKGYVIILKREKILDVPAMAEKIKDLIRVLTNVWRMKKMIMDCMAAVNTRTQDQTDFL